MWRCLAFIRKTSECASSSTKGLFKRYFYSHKTTSTCCNQCSYHTLSNLNNITYKSTKVIPLFKLQHTIEQNVENHQHELDCNTFTYRTHTCGELRPRNVDEKVTLCGWVQFVRLSKFLLLRDAYGITQCIVNNKETHISDLPLETVVKIQGTVAKRPQKMVNTKMPTGEIEVIIDSMEVLNVADKLPFNLRDYQKPKEQLRLQYRYIALRFPEMQNIIRQRSKMLHNMRRFLVEKHGFIEVETPTLFCRTPGGAREFVVPTHHAGLFYSLVQSPQQFKQMLMSGGIDRYFQVARCYRDESTRPDRQPEFTQLDIELSFTNLDGVLTLIEQLLNETCLINLPKPPFKRMTYKEAIETYGSDKPDLTYDLKLKNIKDLFPKKANEEGFEVFTLPYTSEYELPQDVLEKIGELTIKYNTKFLLPKVQKKSLGSYFLGNLKDIIGPGNHSIICLGWHENACLCLGELRQYLATKLIAYNLLETRVSHPLWIVDFPLFVQTENGLETCHHPFTAPHPFDLHLLDTNPSQVRSLAYDLVINGNEVAGGSVRVHNIELQEKLLDMLRIDKDKLSHFLHALKSGCPPHAGIALGIDRLVSIACQTESIRDVIAFPKSHEGKDPLSGAPNVISLDDKKYYHIETTK